MKPVIGLTCSLLREQKRNAVNLTYIEAVRAAGALPVVLPYITEPADAREYICRLDGVLFTGGADIDPAYYGEERHEKCGEVCPERDAAEKAYFEALKTLPLPVLGICRGLQTLNAFAGGTLWQDIPSQVGTEVKHSDSTHTIDIVPGTLFEKIIGSPRIEVNSYHHQCVKTLAKGFKVCAVSPDGVVEALCAEDRDDLLAVQYHPEMLVPGNGNAKKIFEWFVSVCRRRTL